MTVDMTKLSILLNALYGYVIKFYIDAGIWRIPCHKTNKHCNIVVSLTSYGRRVKKGVVFYTLVSLLRQKIQPKRIILWLAETEWNDDILPNKLQKLKNKGIEIRYCPDYRSYKKLIPSLKLYPKDIIMTVDDDVIYSPHIIESAIKENLEHPNDILCFNALTPILINGIPQKYSIWQPPKPDTANKLLFPVGVGGILYPPGSLHADVLNNVLFEKLCPSADDVWFWFNSWRQGTIKRYIQAKGNNFSFDALYQYFHKGSALTQINRLEYQNDRQLIELFNYYDFQCCAPNNVL